MLLWWGTTNTYIKVSVSENTELFSLLPVSLRHIVALNATATAKNLYTLISVFPFHSTSSPHPFFFSKKVARVINSESDFTS